MKHISIIALLLSIVIASCSDADNDGTLTSDSTVILVTDSMPAIIQDTVAAPEPKNNLPHSEEDAVNLLLFEKFSLGITYAELKQKFTGVRPLHPEDANEQLGMKGLKESIQDLHFLTYTGKLEFNFKNDTLYRYSIVFTEPNEKKATRLYEQIQNYYNEHLGNSQFVGTEEDNHYAKLHTWYLNPDYLVAIYNLNTGNITIAAQNSKPGQQ